MLAKELGNQVRFYGLEAEKLPEISLKHEIVAVPTVILFRGGKAVDRCVYTRNNRGTAAGAGPRQVEERKRSKKLTMRIQGVKISD